MRTLVTTCLFGRVILLKCLKVAQTLRRSSTHVTVVTPPGKPPPGTGAVVCCN